MMCGSRRWPPGSVFSGMLRLQDADLGALPAVPLPAPHEADDTVRQDEGDDDEEPSEHEEPKLGKGPGEPGLAGVDEHAAEESSDQRAATANRHPDRDLDRVGGA